MKALLTINDIRNTLGKNIYNLKTLTKQWLSELSQKWHFLLSYWQPAYSYGQISTPLQASNWQLMEKKFVFQAHQLTHNVDTRRTDSSSSTGSGHILSGFVKAIRFDGFKIRLFNGLYTFWDNKRLRWGMLFVLLIAPLTKFFYLLLPENGFGEYLVSVGPVHILNTIEGQNNGWYFDTFSMYFWSVGELMAPVMFIFGIFLLFPKKYYPSYLVGVPFGYYLSLLVHRMFFVDSYQSFHGGATSTMTFSFLLLGVVFFMVSDKVLFRKNHRKRASEARIIGLINMPGMTWNDKEEIIRKEVAEVMKVDNELFIRETA